MMPLVESFVLNDDIALYLLRYYEYVICDGCTVNDKRVMKRKTVKGWKGVKSNKLVFSIPQKPNEFRMAARHRSVDVISFGKKTLRFLDRSEVALINQFGKAVEIRIVELLEYEKSLGDLRRAVNILLNKWVPTLFTCSPKSEYEICHPLHIISLLETFGFKEDDVTALWALGTNWALSKYEAKRKG